MKVNVNLELKDAIALQYILCEMRDGGCFSDTYQQLHSANFAILGFNPIFECLKPEYKATVEVNLSAMDGFVADVFGLRKQVLQEDLEELHHKESGLVESLGSVKAEIVKIHGKLEDFA